MPLRPIDVLLKLEWLAFAAVAGVAYRWLGGAWQMFALLVLVPDLSMLGYLLGPRIGALCYNALHTFLGPALLAALGPLLGIIAMQIALVWAFHIAIDRALGYGLKLATGFRDTHLGRIGRDRGS